MTSGNSINYALNASYTPQGALAALQNGANYYSNFFYNNRLQPCRTHIRSTGSAPTNCGDMAQLANLIDFTFGFNNGVSNNGNVVSVANNRVTDRSQTFTYDELNRIKTAQSQATSGLYDWGLGFSYDIWGNLLSATVTKGDDVPMLNVGVDTNNRVNNTGFSFDAAGNMVTDGSYTYTWDAEMRIKTVAGVTYVYDGESRRAQKSNGKLYWYGSTGETIAESNLSGTITDEYIFFTGKRIARRDSAGNVFYYFADHLGTSRVIVQAGQTTACYEADYYPFGGERVITNTCPQNYKFNGKERDSESSLDYFGARYYSSRFGRWLSPDWSATPQPVPYAELTNPQTLNLYSYVANSPVTRSDLDGHSVYDPVTHASQKSEGGLPTESTPHFAEEETDVIAITVTITVTQDQPASGEGNQANLDRRAAIAATAQGYDGNTSMPYTPGHPTCSLFVQKAIAESGAPKPEVEKADGKMGAPAAAEWAGNKVPAGWRILKPGEAIKPGDVAARKVPFVDATGHAAIVTSVSKNGVVTAIAAHATKIGVDMSFQRGSTQYNNVFLRYTGE